MCDLASLKISEHHEALHDNKDYIPCYVKQPSLHLNFQTQSFALKQSPIEMLARLAYLKLTLLLA